MRRSTVAVGMPRPSAKSTTSAVLKMDRSGANSSLTQAVSQTLGFRMTVPRR